MVYFFYIYKLVFHFLGTFRFELASMWRVLQSRCNYVWEPDEYKWGFNAFILWQESRIYIPKQTHAKYLLETLSRKKYYGPHVVLRFSFTCAQNAPQILDRAKLASSSSDYWTVADLESSSASINNILKMICWAKQLLAARVSSTCGSL